MDWREAFVCGWCGGVCFGVVFVLLIQQIGRWLRTVDPWALGPVDRRR